jgi:hypothetical protein
MKVPIGSSTTPQIVFLLKKIMAAPIGTKSKACVEHKTQITLLTRATTGPSSAQMNQIHVFVPWSSTNRILIVGKELRNRTESVTDETFIEFHIAQYVR